MIPFNRSIESIESDRENAEREKREAERQNREKAEAQRNDIARAIADAKMSDKKYCTVQYIIMPSIEVELYEKGYYVDYEHSSTWWPKEEDKTYIEFVKGSARFITVDWSIG